MQPPSLIFLTQKDIKDNLLVLQPDTKYIVTENLKVWQIIFSGDNTTLDLLDHTILVKNVKINYLKHIKIHSSIDRFLNQPIIKRPLITNDFQSTDPQVVNMLQQMRLDRNSRLSWLCKNIINLLAMLASVDPPIIIDARNSSHLQFVNFDIKYRPVPDSQTVRCIDCREIKMQDFGVKNI